MADFEWYRSFVAIYRMGTVSAAAVARHMTQPALSQHLASLEAEVGEPLFLRQPRKMVPTERGIELYNQVAPAVDRLERTTSELRKGSQGTTIRLGAPLEFFKERLARRLAGIEERVIVSFGKTAELLDLLEEHLLDVVVATQHVTRRGLHFARLDTEVFWLVGGAEASLSAPGEDLDAIRAELERQRWISYGEDLPIIRRFWMESFGERPAITARWVVPDLHAIAALVQRGIGISVLPSYLVEDRVQAGLMRRLWAPSRKVQNEIWLVYHTADRNDAVISRFAQRLLAGIPKQRWSQGKSG